MNYTEWQATARQMASDLGIAIGSPSFAITVWPTKFADGHAGEPAIRLDNNAYVEAFNTGYLPTGNGTQSNGGYVYVLASAMTGSDEVVATSPHVMTTAERAANAAFTGLDKAADAAGLPSLAGLQKALGTVGIVAALGVAYLVFAPKFRRGR